MQPSRRIIPDFPHVARLQSPHRASRHRRRHLPPRQHIRRPKRHLRPAFRILRHRNNRVCRVQPHPNQLHSRSSFHPTSISKIAVIPSVARYSTPSRFFCAMNLLFLAFPLYFVTSLLPCFASFFLPESRRPPNHHPTNHQHRQTHHRQNPRRDPAEIHPRYSCHRRKVHKHSRRPSHQNPIHNPSPRRNFPRGGSPIHPCLNELFRQPVPIAFSP